LSQYDINFREYWRILKKRKALVTFVTIVLSIFITFFVYFRAPTPLYTTSCLIEFERSPALNDFRGNYEYYPADDIDTQITMVKSYTVFEKVVEKLGLVPPKDIKENGHLRNLVIATIENLRAKVEVERDGISSILNISVTDTDPAFAQTLVNTIAQSYKETHAAQLMRKSTEKLKYIVSQLADVREKLRKAEDDFNRFTKENKLISIDLQSEKLLARFEGLQAQVRQLKADEAALDGLLTRLKVFIKKPYDPTQKFYSTVANTQYQTTNDTMVGLILRRDTLLRSFTPKHPEVWAVSHRIVESARKMSFLLETQIMGFQKMEADLREELKNVDNHVNVLMEKRLEYDRLKRKVKLFDEMTVLLERKNQEALIRKAEKPETINIVKPALLPTQPINAHNTVSAGVMSVVIGVVLGFVIAFIVETFDTSLGAIEDVEETLGTKVLGVIPQGEIQDIQEELMSKDPEKFKDYSFKHAFGTISHFLPKSMISESFRALRTNIQYKNPGKKARTLAITSSSPEEGKSMISANLAITMAQGGMKTLLVGSDLRKPGIDRSFGVDRSPGLSEVLIGEHPWRETVKTVTDIILGKMSWDEIMLTPGLDNLHIITSGSPPQNPAELIDSTRLEEFIEEVKEEYDVIIFDSSPILSTADAAILGMKVDGVLLVYRVGSISKGLLKRTVSQLEQVQCNLLGVIINGMKPDISPDFQGYKYYSYYYSYGDGKDRKPRGSKMQQAKKPLMMVAAIACLAVGFLWQSGLIASFKQSLRGAPDKTVAVKTSTSGLKAPSGTSVRPTQAVERTTKESVKPTGESVKSTQGPAKPTKELETSTKRLENTTNGMVKKMPMPRRPVETAKDAKSSTPDSPKPGPISKKKEGDQEKIKLNKPNSKPSGSNASKNNGQGVAGSMSKSMPPKAIKPEKAPVEGAAMFSGPFFGKASISDLRKPDILKDPLNYPYTIQLGSFRSLVQAKNAITRYREKGLSPFWREVYLDGNERWFRVCTGLFETREQAKKYREEQNLLKSLVTKTPKAITPTEQAPAEHAQLKKPTGEAAVLSANKRLEIHEEYPRYPYSLQLGSFRSPDWAKKTVASYRDRGLPAYWCEVDLEGKGRLFRVYTGSFENLEQAKKYKEEQNLVPSIVNKTPYTTFVGIFKDKEKFEMKSQSLENLGYFPYSIKGVNGTHRLFVGAFPNEKSAEMQKRELESKGVQNHVIYR
jgi:tyrosine-protein kinase Etk/Wzc